MMRAAALLLAVALAGCFGPSSVAACGLLVDLPARPIDQGVRFDVTEVVGDTLDPRVINYTLHDEARPGVPLVFSGNLEELRQAGRNGTVRYIDTREDALLNVGDGFVVINPNGTLLLRLTKANLIIGSSKGCG